MYSLLDNTIRWYIIISVFLYLILLAYYGDGCISFYNALVIYTFACFSIILWKSNLWDSTLFTSRNLAGTVFAYSVVLVSLYLLMSDYYTDKTFLFSEADAKAYYKHTMALLDRPAERWTSYLVSKRWNFDDWGAPIAFALMFHIIESKLFVNFCYVIMNTIGAVCLFRIGRTIMTTRYAYLAALTYSISSYSLFFMGSFLKEEMLVFIVIVSFYLLYMYRKSNRIGYLIAGSFISLLILFFRPPIVAFVGMSYMMMLLSRTKKGAIRYFVIALILAVSVAGFGLVQDSADKYANGGDFSESYYYNNTSTFQKIVLYVGALFGPFPQMLQFDDNYTYKPLLASGLLFKLLLAFPFWGGLWHAIRFNYKEVWPLFSFAVLEMLGLAVALDGLELRKAMPHVPLFIVAVFWFLDRCDRNLASEATKSDSFLWTRRIFKGSLMAVFFAVLVWNTLKVK